MSTVRECSRATVRVLGEVIKDPSVLTQKPRSINTQLVLQVCTESVFPEENNNNNNNPLVYRRLSDLIYDANNYFDTGLWIGQRIYAINKQVTFEAAMMICQETRKRMRESAEKLGNIKPESDMLIDNFIADGSVLSLERVKLSNNAVEYRELDEAIYATLIWGVLFGNSFLKKTGTDAGLKCSNLTELEQKYKIYLLKTIPENSEMTITQQKIRGIQAIDMLLACTDDRWGGHEDNLLSVPNTYKDRRNSNKLIKEYSDMAENKGFSALLINIIHSLIYTHRLKGVRMKVNNPVELTEIQRTGNMANIYLLREWLNQTNLLPQIMYETKI